MIPAEQILILRNDPFYKKTRGIRYNWRYSKDVVAAPNFSIKIDISKDGKPWEQWGLIWKVIIWLFKRFFISKEIGRFRNEAVERVLDDSLGIDFDVCSLITHDLKWISAKSEKMLHIKNFSTKFITDLEVELCIYRIAGIANGNRQAFMDQFRYKLNCIFDNTIALRMKEDYISSRHDFERFVEVHEPTLINLFKERSQKGNLTNISSDIQRMEGS